MVAILDLTEEEQAPQAAPGILARGLAMINSLQDQLQENADDMDSTDNMLKKHDDIDARIRAALLKSVGPDEHSDRDIDLDTVVESKLDALVVQIETKSKALSLLATALGCEDESNVSEMVDIIANLIGNPPGVENGDAHDAQTSV